MKNLACLNIGDEGIVREINLEEKTLKRITDMGLTVDSKVKLHGKAPLGDPLLIKVRDCYLAIRRVDATNILLND